MGTSTLFLDEDHAYLINRASTRLQEALVEKGYEIFNWSRIQEEAGIVVDGAGLEQVLLSMDILVLGVSSFRHAAPPGVEKPVKTVQLIDVGGSAGTWFVTEPSTISSWKWANRNVSTRVMFDGLNDCLAPRLSVPIQLHYPSGPIVQRLPQNFTVSIKSVPWYRSCSSVPGLTKVPETLYDIPTGRMCGSESYLPFGGETIFFAEGMFPVAALFERQHLYVHCDLFRDETQGVLLLRQLVEEMLEWYRDPEGYESTMCAKLREASFEQFCQFQQEYRVKRIQAIRGELGQASADARKTLGDLFACNQKRRETVALKRLTERHMEKQREELLRQLVSLRELPEFIEIRSERDSGLTLVRIGPLQRRHPVTGRVHDLGQFVIHLYRPNSQYASTTIFNLQPRVVDAIGVVQAPNVGPNGVPQDISLQLQVGSYLEQGKIADAVMRLINYLVLGNPTDRGELAVLNSFPEVPQEDATKKVPASHRHK
jgi:hypothetical protein